MAYTAFALKSCARCNGDMARDQDWTGPYWTCLNCGGTVYPSQPPKPLLGMTVGLLVAMEARQSRP